MNYYTMLPNYYNAFNLTFPVSCPRPQQKTQSVLQLLSEALKRSISQYEACYVANQPQIHEQMPKIAEKQEENKRNSVQELILEEKVEKNNIFQIKEKEQHQQKYILQENQQKVHKNSIQTASNDEISSQNLLCQLNKAKDGPFKTILKQHTRSRKHSFTVIVPSVDLIETAYLPTFHINQQEMRIKRNNLLEREVKCWDVKIKGRGDKREIRMLIG